MESSPILQKFRRRTPCRPCCIKLAETARAWQGGQYSARRCVPTVACPLSKVAQTRKSCLPPVYRKPGLYYEVRRRLEALPGVSHDCPVTLP